MWYPLFSWAELAGNVAKGLEGGFKEVRLPKLSEPYLPTLASAHNFVLQSLRCCYLVALEAEN